MSSPKKTCLRVGILTLVARKLLQSMKQRMNDHYVGMDAIDPRRQQKVARTASKSRVPSAQESVQEHPGEKLHDMRTRNGRNLVPENGARLRGSRRPRRVPIVYGKTFNPLRIQVDLATVIACEPFQQFRERALRSMAAVHKRRDNREPQVSVSSAAQAGLPARSPRIAPKARESAAGRAIQAAARGMRSKESPRKLESRHTLRER